MYPDRQTAPSAKPKLIYIFVSAYLVLIVAIIVGIVLSHKHSTNMVHPGITVPVYSGIQDKAQNSKRQVDIQSLQTQVEAFFSQNGYYPSLSDLNSASWRSTNMPGLDVYGLADPLSTCNPTTTACLVATPEAGSYAYDVSDSSDKSCEQADTNCAKYTMTATYQGSVNGATTYSKSNLD